MVKKSQKRLRSKSKLGKKTKKNNKFNSNVKVIEVSKIMTDKEISDREGEYFPESHYNIVVSEDADVWGVDDDGSRKLLLRFRKNVIPEELTRIGLENLKKAAMKKHDNRGAAAGKIDLGKMPKYANDPKQFVKRSKFRISGYISKDTGKYVNNSIGNLSMSNIIGYFDRVDRNIRATPENPAPPCRTTAFSSQQVSKWKKVIPLIRSIDRQFKELIPDKYRLQYKRAHQTPFVIKDTAFSTLTINYNWRTALHKDAGDFLKGYGNLVIIEEPGEKRYHGGFTGFPQYGVCVDVRNGDFLAMDVHEWHANTEIVPIKGDHGEEYSRLSLVAYLREGMIKCKNMKLS